MISKDKTYRTRDGREVRIYATDAGRNSNIVHGATHDAGWGWVPHVWLPNGSHERIEDLDLIEVKPRIKRTVYLHIYDDHTKVSDTPIQLKMHKPRACVKVDLDFEEGEGL